jgi:hypothetical protein
MTPTNVTTFRPAPGLFTKRKRTNPLARTFGPASPMERAARYVTAVRAYETIMRHPLTAAEAKTVEARAAQLIRAEAYCLIASFPPSEFSVYYVPVAGFIVEVAHRFDDSSYCEILDDVVTLPPAPNVWQRACARVHGFAIRSNHRLRRLVGRSPW